MLECKQAGRHRRENELEMNFTLKMQSWVLCVTRLTHIETIGILRVIKVIKLIDTHIRVGNAVLVAHVVD